MPKLLDPKLTWLSYLPELCKFISQGGSENAFLCKKNLLICEIEQQREIKSLEYAGLDLKGKFNLRNI